MTGWEKCQCRKARILHNHIGCALLRFGSELVFSMCELYGVEVVILNKTPDVSPEEDLVKDVLEIITVFSAKLHSMRSRKNVLKDTAPHIALLEENLSKLAEISKEN